MDGGVRPPRPSWRVFVQIKGTEKPGPRGGKPRKGKRLDGYVTYVRSATREGAIRFMMSNRHPVYPARKIAGLHVTMAHPVRDLEMHEVGDHSKLSLVG